MNIVFATTCKGRAFHLAETLPQNLADNPNSKFVVLDYNSQDNLQEILAQYADNPQVVVYRYPYADRFRIGHAKNMAHRCAILEGADVVVNLDADNYTGPGFEHFLAREFAAIPGVFLQAVMIRGKMNRGCLGRIAVEVGAFLKAGGYDEAKFVHWGSDDKDFNLRLRALGYDHVEIPPSYLWCIKHNDKVRFKEYPEAAKLASHYFEVSRETITRSVVNDGRVGCGTVYRNGDATPIQLKPIPTRIFGIGMHKTATTSLNAALKCLGYDSAHWISGMWARDIWEEVRSKGRSDVLERHYALCDLPIPMLFRELDAGYPGSKFILTTRNEAKWLESVRKHWSYEHNEFRWQWDVYPINNKFHKWLYGRTTFDPDVMLARYRRHNQEVRDYFRSRPDDLLIMDMDAGAGWNDLCRFLDRGVPEMPYPREYVTQPIELRPQDEIREYGPYNFVKIGESK